MNLLLRSLVPCTLALSLSACGDSATLPDQSAFGPNPILPEPVHDIIPTIKVAAAKGWPADKTPVPAEGLAVQAFASSLDHPRWLYVLPNGDVLVAETNGPSRPDDRKGIEGWVSKKAQERAGAAVRSANRITLLRDSQGKGVADTRAIFLEGLNSPFGMALVGNFFYVADTDAILRFPYKDGETMIAPPGEKIADLPAGSINHHWTKNLIASPDGSRLYVTVGSNSNVAENGLDAEVGRAAILEVDLASRQTRVFASGLRNPNGMMWEPETGALWTVVNERDELGSDLVPDYLTSVKENGFYGWPFSYYGQHLDSRVKPQRPDLVRRAIRPDYALGNHTASLGLAYATGVALPPPFRRGVFIGQHGSWNRQPYSGYKVVFVPFTDGRPSGPPEDVLSGFINPQEDIAYGRPVGVVMDKSGALLVADDVGNCVWRVSAAAQPGRSASKSH